jgi:hypothetical protein
MIATYNAVSSTGRLFLLVGATVECSLTTKATTDKRFGFLHGGCNTTSGGGEIHVKLERDLSRLNSRALCNFETAGMYSLPVRHGCCSLSDSELLQKKRIKFKKIGSVFIKHTKWQSCIQTARRLDGA